MSGLSLFGSGLTITEAQGPTYYLGTWNASTNTPTLASSTAPAGPGGSYYIVSVAGTTNLNGITDWTVGDWVIWSGSVWQKLEGGMTSVTVGSTQIAGGTTGRVLYDNAGVLGEMTNTGTGTVSVLQTSPALITPILGAATGTSLALGGALTLSNGTAALPALNIGGNNKGFYGSVHETIGVADGTARWSFGLTAMVLNTGYNFGWGTISGALDTNLSRISAGIIGVGTGAAGNVAGGLQAATLALGGASGATLAVTGTANISGTATIGGAVNATSSVNSVDGRFTQSSGPIIDLRTANTVKFFRSDNVTLANVEGGSLALGGAAIGSNALAVTGVTQFNSNVWVDAAVGFGVGGVRGNISAPSDGVFLLRNTSGTDFNRLQFGGTTNLFPAIKRNAAALDVRLADDSAYATVNALNFIASTYLQAGTTGAFYIGARGSVSAPADGVWLLKDSAGTSFSMLQFGGTTSSFPALKRSGTTLEVKLADDSAYAPIAIGNTVNSVSPTSPNRTVTMVIGGTTYYLAAKTTND